MIGEVPACMGIMEAPNLYLAIRVTSLQMVLALAAGEAPKFSPTTEWKTSPSTDATIKAPARPS